MKYGLNVDVEVADKDIVFIAKETELIILKMESMMSFKKHRYEMGNKLKHV